MADLSIFGLNLWGILALWLLSGPCLLLGLYIWFEWIVTRTQIALGHLPHPISIGAWNMGRGDTDRGDTGGPDTDTRETGELASKAEVHDFFCERPFVFHYRQRKGTSFIILAARLDDNRQITSRRDLRRRLRRRTRSPQGGGQL